MHPEGSLSSDAVGDLSLARCSRDERLADALSKARALVPAQRTLTIRRGDFQAFVRLSEREVRPVEEVMAEWLADCAHLIGSQVPDEFDGCGLARPCTPSMRLAAEASDAREEHAWKERLALTDADGGGIHPALVEFLLVVAGE